MRSGFTLIEMAVVMALIAIVTHLAVRELGQFRDRKLTLAADRQLEAIKQSILNRDGEGEVAGFLADMGRMVAPTNGTLAELWQLPNGARPYALRKAVRDNIVAGARVALGEDAAVYVPTGWRGPYLRLPMGKDKLLDPWGNAMEERDSAGLRRLWVTNNSVKAVSHYGYLARAHGERTLSVVPDGGECSRLVVTPISTSGSTAGEITYKWYGPASGMITGAVARAAYPTPVVFEGLTPGIRILKDSASGVARKLQVKPGDNLVEVKVP